VSDEQLRIERIASGGDGVARAADGIVVFVPRTAPGDLVRARVRREKRMARGRMLEVLEPGPDRIEPPCRHYTADRCGGCQVQHLAYDAQLAAKGQIIHDALRRIGGRAQEPPVVRPSAGQWRYRRKLTLAMRRTESDLIAGLHPYDDPVGVFRLRDCPITEERVLAVWKEVLAARRHLPRVRMLRGAVRMLDGGGATFVLEGGAAWPKVRDFFDAVPSLVELWWVPDGHRRRLVRQREAPQAGASFAQVNAPVAAALREHALERVQAHSPFTVIDAYAGTGDTAELLAAGGVRVTAIEIDRDAAATCAARLPGGSRVLVGPVEALLPGALPADVAIVNPPRAGLDEQVTRTIEASSLRAIVYVSCNPATLARDLARMPSYRLASVVGFDMFPQTAHVETVCELVRTSVGEAS
jgi:23S rRNA (uracil1939-C5)-methyltransferase